MDKFYTLAEIFRMISNRMTNSEHFKPLTVNDVEKPRNRWTRKQRCGIRLQLELTNKEDCTIKQSS
jgi:hypothetical protein